MEVRFIDDARRTTRTRDPDDVVELFSHADGFFWIDIPTWDDEAEAVLSGLGCHPMVIEGCRQRNYVPTVHGYDDHVFITTQSPYLGRAGHVHLLELDQIIGHHYLVTVHGPINPALDISVALVETVGVLAAWRAVASTRRRRPSCRTPSPRPSRGGNGARSPRSRRSCPGWRRR